MHPRWTQLHRFLQEFQSLLTPQAPQLEIYEGVGHELETSSPSLKKPGVYLLFNADIVLKYVGSATCEPMIDRVRMYLKTKNRLEFTPQYIDVIPFEWEWSFFAPALELYLIQKIECNRLMSSGDRLLNSVGMIAGLREWFNLTYGAVRRDDEATPPNQARP